MLLASRAFDVRVYGVCPFRRLQDFITDEIDAVVLVLSHTDSSIEVRELVSQFPATAFLLVAPHEPAQVGWARLAETLSAGLVADDEEPAVFAATLTSLLAQQPASAATPNRTSRCLTGLGIKEVAREHSRTAP
jgi:hypothetical protein